MEKKTLSLLNRANLTIHKEILVLIYLNFSRESLAQSYSVTEAPLSPDGWVLLTQQNQRQKLYKVACIHP